MAKMIFEDLCGKVCEVAREAGEYIKAERKRFDPSRIEYKGAHNMVSYVDKGAEKLLVDRLSVLLPGSGFITEEGTASANGERYRWVIDPLDGTTNFIHGMPPYCVSVALMEGDKIVIGVIHEITLDETFYAWEGGGAWLNGEAITVSAVSDLSNALIAVGFSYKAFREDDGYIDQVVWYQTHSDGIRRIGSSATDLAYIACGRLDAFCQIGLSPWDVAAGILIVREAGGVVTDNSGGDNCVFGGELVAASPGIYNTVIERL